MGHSPFDLFRKWYEAEKRISTSRIPSACCLSTIGLDGFPNSRFLSLKEVLEGCFIVTGPINSRKGLEMENNPRVALAFWWPFSEKQVRMQGMATRISDELADSYFAERGKESQIVSIVSQQGKELDDPEMLSRRFDEFQEPGESTQLTRPVNWGGYAIEPTCIEFLEFAATRFHKRTLFMIEDGEWVARQLQP